MKKILRSCILSIAVIILLSFSVFAAEMIVERAQSGFCGVEAPGKKLLTWSLDDEGTLTISGSGEMKNYASHKDVPWYSSRAYIQKLSISEGVTSIGDYAFYDCIDLTSVSIPVGVTSIGKYAFASCDGLISVSIPSGVTSISESAFLKCEHLTTLNIAKGVKSIGEYAFYGCDLVTANIPSSITSIASSAFMYCDHLKDVYYTGTEEEWENIFIDSNNDSLTRATIHYNTPMLTVSVSETVSGSTAYTVSVENLPTTAVIVAALYHKGRFVGFEHAEYRGKAVVIETATVHDSAKIMAWESLESMKPLCGEAPAFLSRKAG